MSNSPFGVMRRVIGLCETLTHVVQSREKNGAWNTIAAFDNKRIAERYAADCARSSTAKKFKFEYQALDLEVAYDNFGDRS